MEEQLKNKTIEGLLETNHTLTILWEQVYSKCKKDIQLKRDIKIFEDKMIKKMTLEAIGLEVGLTKEGVRLIVKKTWTQILEIIEREFSKIPMQTFCEHLCKELSDKKVIDLDVFKIDKEEYKLFDFIFNDLFEKDVIFRRVDNVVILRSAYKRILENIEKLATKHKIMSIDQILIHGERKQDIELYEKLLLENRLMFKIDNQRYYYSQGPLNKGEEIYIILYRTGRPLYYTEIPQKAKEFGLPLSTQPGKNILASMERNNLMQWISRGTYALKEWDMPKMLPIKELVYMVMKDLDRPLSLQELFEETQKRRIDKISKRSVGCYLLEHEEIVRASSGYYLLKEWAEDAEKLRQYSLRINQTETLQIIKYPQLMLDVFKDYGHYFIKYKLSQGVINSDRLRVSNKIKIDFHKQIVIIQEDKEFRFQTYNRNRIYGLNRWHYVPSLNEIFYLEFINEKVIRFLSEEQYKNYKPIGTELLKDAEMFWEEQKSIIRIDISSIKVGQVFTSKANLYRAIGIEPVSGKKNRKYQDREVGRYVSFKRLDENKRSIMITKTFLKPKIKIDKRGKHGKQSGNSTYAKEMDLLVTAMMQKRGDIDASYNTIFTKEIQLFTLEYEKSRPNNSFCMSHVNFIEYNTINTYLITITNKVLGAFLRSLDRLQKKNIIDYKKIYKIIYGEHCESTTATDEEVQVIKKIQSQVYERLGISSNSFIPHKLRLQCRKEIIKILRESTEIYSFWNSYHIRLVDQNLENISKKEIDDARRKITQLFIISTHSTMDKKIGFTSKGDMGGKYTPFTSREQISKIIKLDSLFWIYNRENIDFKNYFYDGQYLTNLYCHVLERKYNNSDEDNE